MQRIATLLQKLNELSLQGKNNTAIDIDLMLDYTRVLYADLLELRKNTPITAPLVAPKLHETTGTQVSEPVAENKYANVPDNDIRTLIGINDKYLFVSELFGEDKIAYDAAIKHLNTFNNLTDATNWVKAELHQKYQWDKESETVQSFYNLLSSCFPSI